MKDLVSDEKLIKWRGFLILNYVTLASIASTIITPALTHIQSNFSISKVQVDWLMTLYLIGYALGQIFYGPLSNKTGRVWSLRIGIIVHIIGLLIGAFSIYICTYWLLLLSRFLTAFGGASGLVCAFILINETFDEDQAKTLIPYIGLFFSVSVVLSIFIGGLLSLYLGLVYCFYFNILHAIILLVLTRKIKETIRQSDLRLHPQPSEIKWSCPAFRRTLTISIGASLLATFTYIYSTAIPVFAEKELGLNEASYGFWNLINLAGMVLCAIFAGKWSIKYGTAKIAKVGYFLFCVALIMLLLFYLLPIKSPLLLFLISSFSYFSAGVASACAAYFASNALKNKAMASALLNFIALLFGGLSLFVLSYLSFKTFISFLVTLGIFYCFAIFSFLGSKVSN